jgi:hypothetical protein
MSQEQEDLKQAIALIKTGKTSEAVPILKNILKTNRNDEPSWLWLAYCVDSTDDKTFCFREALRINPNNERTKKALEQLDPGLSPQPDLMEDTSQKPKKKRGYGVFIVAALLVLFYNIFGFVTIQPIGALPEGVTLLVFRSGTQLKFFDSPDAMCERLNGGVSLLCRGSVLSALADKKQIIVLRLPYIETFYLASTGGATYEN